MRHYQIKSNPCSCYFQVALPGISGSREYIEITIHNILMSIPRYRTCLKYLYSRTGVITNTLFSVMLVMNSVIHARLSDRDNAQIPLSSLLRHSTTINVPQNLCQACTFSEIPRILQRALVFYASTNRKLRPMSLKKGKQQLFILFPSQCRM